jgi:hypothetical protein
MSLGFFATPKWYEMNRAVNKFSREEYKKFKIYSFNFISNTS